MQLMQNACKSAGQRLPPGASSPVRPTQTGWLERPQSDFAVDVFAGQKRFIVLQAECRPLKQRRRGDLASNAIITVLLDIISIIGVKTTGVEVAARTPV